MATQAFKGIDLDITHYDTDELLTMLNLTDPTEDDIIRATDRLINKANADRLPKVAAFSSRPRTRYWTNWTKARTKKKARTKTRTRTKKKTWTNMTHTMHKPTPPPSWASGGRTSH